jgi:cytidylate kinase
VCHYDGITPEEAKHKIESGDEKRAAYYNYYTGKTWAAAASYDLCINSSKLGIEATTQYIIDFVKKVRG